MSWSRDHDHGHAEFSGLAATTRRVRTLESLLVEKGHVDPDALGIPVETNHSQIGPRNGARVVARHEGDPDQGARLISDTTEAIASLGYSLKQGEDILIVKNTLDRHDMIVCTPCSCYNWTV